MRLLGKGALYCLAALMYFMPASQTLADWHEGDGHKMHFPQLPDPLGWDVEISSFTDQHECADDWLCTQTGPVSDIHFWYSVADRLDTVIGTVVVNIYSDDRTSQQFSQPGSLLWTGVFHQPQFTDLKNYGTGLQGFADPQYPETWVTGQQDHEAFHQINIRNIENPFIQQEGTMYWLGLYVYWEGTQSPVGWKTSTNHYADAAVYRAMNGAWTPLDPQYDPPVPYRMDFAFVITPEPSSFVLFSLGAIGLALIAWRRR